MEGVNKSNTHGRDLWVIVEFLLSSRKDRSAKRQMVINYRQIATDLLNLQAEITKFRLENDQCSDTAMQPNGEEWNLARG
jgi:hypothetical protein